MIVYRSFRIHASRFLPKLSDNHICKKMHGHTFNIKVTVKAEINNKDGFVIDFYDIDRIFNKHIHQRIDHTILNDVKGLENPTSEYLCKWIWDNLEKYLDDLYEIEVSEDHGTGIIYTKNEKRSH
tara:strand:+ start:856 stop:1230 length:375 start_codon:yes stop_codon:yes gene_type:complete